MSWPKNFKNISFWSIIFSYCMQQQEIVSWLNCDVQKNHYIYEACSANQWDEPKIAMPELVLVNRKCSILLHSNAQPMLQKLNELVYIILPHPPYPSDLPLTYHHLFKHLNNFLQGKCFDNQQDAKNAFQEFAESQGTDFYSTGIPNLLLIGNNVLIVMVPILSNKDVFEPSYNDLKFTIWSQNYICIAIISLASFIPRSTIIILSLILFSVQFSSVQSLSWGWLFATPWIAACQASLSITNSQSSLRLMSIESVMPSSHLILCHPLLLLPPIPPSIRVFSNESTLRRRWPKYWSFSFSIIPSKEIPGLISFRMDWLDLLVVQGTLKSLLQHHSSKASILLDHCFFIICVKSDFLFLLPPQKSLCILNYLWYCLNSHRR